MIWFQVLGMLLLTALAGCLYRLGGTQKRGLWYDFLVDTKARDIGVPLCVLAAMTLLWMGQATERHQVLAFSFALLVCGLLHFAAMTTYWKKKGTEALWWNWLLVGFFYSVSMAPFATLSGNWLGFYLRTVFLTMATTLWSVVIGHDVLEEAGRGVLDVATVPLLLI
jgi:hypothetical protein